jgi:hypothetical protein
MFYAFIKQFIHGFNTLNDFQIFSGNNGVKVHKDSLIDYVKCKKIDINEGKG